MEPYGAPWLQPVGGNQLQIGRPSKSQKQARYVATGCHWLPPEVHGKGAPHQKGRGSLPLLRKKRQVLRTRALTGLGRGQSFGCCSSVKRLATRRRPGRGSSH